MYAHEQLKAYALDDNDIIVYSEEILIAMYRNSG